jgi:hypothetical protein
VILHGSKGTNTVDDAIHSDQTAYSGGLYLLYRDSVVDAATRFAALQVRAPALAIPDRIGCIWARHRGPEYANRQTTDHGGGKRRR